ncbi:hypothetical protein PVK06_035018 [Gossypium arboreum]|uniref:Uncharacterized protein n=1 Tax=Gossypium arboreum TaxID=29729 RepID=A0ABR0NG88_GOSAR|nr:hypothetical protein PVK06_035018 [Gossypium arboreum]
MVSNPIDIIENATIDVEVTDDLTTTLELKLVLNESVEEPIHFLAKIEEVPSEKALPQLKEVVHDVLNFDHKDLCTIVNHDEFNREIQQEFGTVDHGNDLNIIEAISNIIDIAANVTVDVEVTDNLTTTMELKLILNESVEDPIHFLAKIEEVPTEEVEEFI